MNKTFNTIISISILSIVFMLCLFGLLKYENNHIYRRSVQEFKKGKENNICYEIENKSENEISGWFIRKGKTYSYYNYGMDVNGESVYNNMKFCFVVDGIAYILPTKLERRADITEKMSDGIDYKYCGFRAHIINEIKYIGAEKKYGIIVKNPKGEEILYELSEKK